MMQFVTLEVELAEGASDSYVVDMLADAASTLWLDRNRSHVRSVRLSVEYPNTGTAAPIVTLTEPETDNQKGNP